MKITAIHTPGHRPEHTAFALADTDRGDEAWAVLTGDSLFVGDIARPDLAVDKEEGAQLIFRSLHERLLSLPSDTEVWPGHLGGSLCGGPGMDMKVSSTIGFESRHNDLLQIDDEREFVEQAIGALGPQPPNFKAIVALNKGPLVTAGVELPPLTPRQLDEKRKQGALLVDVRTDLQFDEAHIPDSVSNSAQRAGFGTKLAWIADRDQEIVLIGRDDDEAFNAAVLAVAVGIRKLGGYLHGGMTVWRADRRPVERIERMRIDKLHERSEEDSDLQILDVREQSEWDDGHIPGSTHVPYHDIHSMPDALDPAKPIAAVCASGQRSAVAASLLQRFGGESVIHVVDGGVGTWERAGHPIER